MTVLALGTAQFGSGYGITNTVGRLSDRSVHELVVHAAERGIRVFDTASAYGDAEARLGHALAGVGESAVVTKFTLPGGEQVVTEDLLIGRSRARLGATPLYAVLFHRVEDMRSPRLAEALAVLRTARDEGTVQRIGVSIYDMQDLELALEVFPDLDILQVPGNVVDRRLLDSRQVGVLHDAGVEIHVRSVFLQGLLLARPDNIPARFAALVPVVSALHRKADEEATSVAGLLVQQIRDHPVADALVLGATSVAELDQLIEAFADVSRERLAFDDVPVEIIDPRLW